MKQTKIRFSATIAKQSNFRLVARLCRRAVGPSDYVLRDLRETITRRGLFLAWSDKELVGISNFNKCIDGSGWLSMARTDPGWRRTGVAHFLQKQIATYARRRGITTLRLWTLSGNKPSINASQTGGFKRVCEAAHISCYLRSTSNAQAIRPLRQASETLLGSLLQSKHLARMNGYFAYKWHFVKASKPLLKLILRQGEFYRIGDSSFILTRPEKAFGELRTSLTLLTGTVTGALRSSKAIAQKLGARAIGAYVPYDAYILNSAKELGFKRDRWGQHCLVFERKLN